MIITKSLLHTASAMVLALVASVASIPASAVPPDDPSEVRIVHRVEQLMPQLARDGEAAVNSSDDQHLASAETLSEQTGQVPLPQGVSLTVGESVLVYYSDGIVLHEMVSAGCIVTASAGKPFKNATYNSAQASFSYGLSSGCGSSQGVSAYLRSTVSPYGLKHWTKYASTEPGRTVSWAVSTPCVKGYSRTWSSQIGSPAIGSTPSVTLACEGSYFS